MSFTKICMYNITTTIKTGGIETFYWEVSKELQKKGYEVELISGEGHSIKYKNIPLRQFSYISREHIWNLGNRFRKWGERVSFFIRAWPYMKQQKYDICLIHKPLDFFTAYFMKKNNPEMKIVFMSGGEDFYGFDKFFVRYIDNIFAVSKNNAEIIKKRYGRIIPVIPNGVDPEEFQPNQEKGKIFKKKYKLESSPVLISVGRIVGLKGFQLVIELLQFFPDYKYVLIGGGEYLEHLKQLSQSLNVEKQVLFLGNIDNKELPDYLNMGDIFIQPTIGNEAFGITVIEAMACNLPVIASYNGGMKDIVIEGENGLFFEKGNIESLKKSLEELIKEKDTMKPREYVVKYFTWENTVNQLLNQIDLEKKE